MVSERICCWRYFFNGKVAYVKKGIQKARHQRNDKSLYTEGKQKHIYREVLLLMLIVQNVDGTEMFIFTGSTNRTNRCIMICILKRTPLHTLTRTEHTLEQKHNRIQLAC